VLDELVAAQPVEIHALTRQNIRAQRARLGLTQASVAHRMNQLGFTWYPQTVGLVERNKRPLDIAEVCALALCLDTRLDLLVLAPLDVEQLTFGEHQVPAQRLIGDDGSVVWEGDELTVRPPAVQFNPLDLRMAAEPDQRVRAGVYALREQLGQEASSDPALTGPQSGEQSAVDLQPGWQTPERSDE
jgi:transcriptional regulator with XRE-family HTH domain